jgi:hypothetical protein
MIVAMFFLVVAVTTASAAGQTGSILKQSVSGALKCAFAKQKVVVKETAALLVCGRKALAAQTAVDPACTAAAVAKLEKSFRKIEAKGGCEPAGDAPVAEGIADQCTAVTERFFQGTCLAAGATCDNLNLPPCCTGLRCVPRVGGVSTCR